MRDALINALAQLYVVALDWGPISVALAVALWRSYRFDRSRRLVKEARAQFCAAPRTYEERVAEDALINRQLHSRRHGWTTFAVFLSLLAGLYLLADFIRFNAHNIIREAHRIAEINESDGDY